ncbi:hypothetical protein HON22_02870 [Candidatus Peregrinibacteria bacterium]|nr:hypothetical protein [Candidatus Peregrinibacteria bacterium]
MKHFFLLLLAFVFSIGIAAFTSPSVEAIGLEQIKNLSKDSKIDQSVENPILKPKYLPEFDVPENEQSAEAAAKSFLYNVINFFLTIAGISAIVVIIVGGFMYVVNAGVEEIQTRAKNTIIYAIIGLFVIFLSYAMVENTIRYLYQQDKGENYQPVDALPQTDFISAVEVPEINLDYGAGTFNWFTVDVRNVVYDVYYNGEKVLEKAALSAWSAGQDLYGEDFLFQVQAFVVDEAGNIRNDLKSGLAQLRGEDNTFNSLFNLE